MSTSPKPETINSLFDAAYPSFALLAAMELDLFSPLADKGLSATEIAEILTVESDKLRPLLYVLVVAGLLTVEDDLFANTLEAEHYLVKAKSDYLGGLQGLMSNNWVRILNTAETIRAGGTLEKYDYHEPSQDELIALFRGLYPGAVADARRLMEHYDFSSDKTVLDVGGGSGALAITIAEANPHLKTTVMDLPSATLIAKQFIDEANMSERVKTLTADAVNDTLTGQYDVILARHLLQVLSAEDCRKLLKNIASIIKPRGTLHIIGWVLDNSRLTPAKTVNYNLILLNGYDDGQAYTEQEYHEWLSEVGFEAFERRVFSDGTSILTAYKPA